VSPSDEALWQAYRRGDAQAYEALVERYLPVVKITVGRIAMNLPSFVDYEELYSTGCMGLLSAIQRYDPQREAKFTTYAITRIRGAVFDELRHHDRLGRVTRDRVTRIREAEESLRAQGQDPGPDRVASAADLTPDEYRDAVLCERASRLISLSEPVSAQEGGRSLAEVLEERAVTPQRLSLEDAEILELVTDALTDRERRLVALYYGEELTLKEIGLLLGVSESRVSQLHAEMLARIRKLLQRQGV